MKVFDRLDRKDQSPKRSNESMFEFLNRSGSTFFAPVRELLEMWVDDLPAEDGMSVAANLRSGEDEAFESAFWELYLYRVLKGSGYEVDIHPHIPGTTRHPDFLVRGEQPFYLEAVSVGSPPGKRTAQRRLREVEAVLDSTRVEGWTLSFNWHRIGPEPLKATHLRNQLVAWLAELPEGLRDAAFTNPPIYSYDDRGWQLAFSALPVSSDHAPLVAIRGAGRAVGVDNKSGLRRVLDAKSRRYGRSLPHPLVTAVLSNTEFPTRIYEVQPTLYGMHWLGPARVIDFTELSSDGHWRTARGWRRSHNPYVVVGAGINVFNMQKQVPWLWRTLDPAVSSQLDLSWAAAVDVTVPEPDAPTTTPDLTALGITDNWCTGTVDFTKE